MTEMLATFLKLFAGALQLFNIAIKFFNVLLSLFGSQTFSFSAREFSLSAFALGSFSLRRRRADVFEIFFVGEVNDRDNRKRGEHRVKADRVLQLHNTAGYKGA